MTSSFRHGALPIGDALARCEPLARLRERLRESEACWAAVAPCLPAALAAQVRPGPVDEQGFALLAANASVAAKLRNLRPRLEAALAAARLQGSPIRIRLQSD